MSRPLGPHIIMYPSGRQVSLLAPEPSDIELRDLAHHMALANRFAGGTLIPYTVAQHAVLVAELMERDSARLALFGLLHAGHAAYLTHWPAPLRYLYAGTALSSARSEAEARFDRAIFTWSGLGEPTAQESRAIQLYASAASATEWRDLMPPDAECPIKMQPAPFRIKTWPWHKAEERFIAAFDRLSRLAGVTPLSC